MFPPLMKKQKTFFNKEDFQDFWLHANEDIQSSESGIHFGHYKAASYNKFLFSMNAAKLTLATKEVFYCRDGAEDLSSYWKSRFSTCSLTRREQFVFWRLIITGSTNLSLQSIQ